MPNVRAKGTSLSVSGTASPQLPLAHRLTGHPHLLGQLFLGQAQAGTLSLDDFSDRHTHVSFRPYPSKPASLILPAWGGTSATRSCGRKTARFFSLNTEKGRPAGRPFILVLKISPAARASWRSTRCSRQDGQTWARKEREPRRRRQRRWQ